MQRSQAAELRTAQVRALAMCAPACDGKRGPRFDGTLQQSASPVHVAQIPRLVRVCGSKTRGSPLPRFMTALARILLRARAFNLRLF